MNYMEKKFKIKIINLLGLCNFAGQFAWHNAIVYAHDIQCLSFSAL